MQKPPGPAVPIMAAASLLVIALYSWGGYTMVAAFSASNPGYPGHARAAMIWSVAMVLALGGAMLCSWIAYRRYRVLRGGR